MTRAYTTTPIWTWKCDRCGRESTDLAREQQRLPTLEEMRDRGWHIAEKWGDLCPNCVRAREPLTQNNPEQASGASMCQRCNAIVWIDRVQTDVGPMHATCARAALRAAQLDWANSPADDNESALAEEAGAS